MRCRCRDTIRDTDSREAERRRDGPQPARLRKSHIDFVFPLAVMSTYVPLNYMMCSTRPRCVFVGRAKATNI